MTYKTLLVHFNDQRRAAQLLRIALSLARRLDAHLIGAFVVPAPMQHEDLEMAVRGPLLAFDTTRLKAEAQRIRTQFDVATKGQTMTAEWLQIEAEHPDILTAVLPHARSADLIIASQSDPEWQLAKFMDVPDDLVLATGRPVLLVPYIGTYETIGERVLIAWQERREAARAVFDAVPLMGEAKEVRVLQVHRDKSPPDGKAWPASGVVQALGRHGINATESHSVAVPGMDTGNERLSRAADRASDLLVRGGYGHSRLRERVLGGATRSILQQMTLPVLMSH